MSRSGKLRLLKRWRLLSVAAVLIIASFMVLKSLWAASLFQELGSEMTRADWKASDDDPILQPGETVTFEARYFIFKLGTVKFELLGKTVCCGRPAYRIRALIDSYSGLPFVNFHAVYETCADASKLICLSTSNDQKDGDEWIHTSYDINYDEKNMVWEQSIHGALIKSVDLPLDTTYTDGLSFFYYVRKECAMADGKKKYLSIPIVSDTNRSTVDMYINEAVEPCKVSIFDFPVLSERMSGHINFKGTFGVTGDFVGWISDDSAEVPLRADLRVIIGSVVVKLKDIRRDGWVPRKAR